MPQEFDEYGIPIKTSKGQVEEQSFDEFGIPIKKKEETPSTSGGAYVRPLSQDGGEPAQSFSEATLGRLSDEQYAARTQQQINRENAIQAEAARKRKEQFYANVKPISQSTTEDIDLFALNNSLPSTGEIYQTLKNIEINKAKGFQYKPKPIAQPLPSDVTKTTITPRLTSIISEEERNRQLALKAKEKEEEASITEIKEEATPLQKTLTLASNVAKGAIGVGRDFAQVGDLLIRKGIENTFEGEPKKYKPEVQGIIDRVRGYNLQRGDEAFEKDLGQYFYEHPEYKTSDAAQTARGLGQVIPSVVVGLLTGGTGAFAQTAIQGTLSGTQIFNEAYKRAKEYGTDDETAIKTAFLDAVGESYIDAFPTLKILNRFNKTVGGGFWNKAKQSAKETGIAFVEGGTSEGLQKIVSNAIASYNYDENVALLDDVFEEGKIGGFTQSLLSLGLSAIKHARVKAKTPEQKAELDKKEASLYDVIKNKNVVSPPMEGEAQPPAEGGAPPPTSGTTTAVEEAVTPQGEVAPTEQVTPQGEVTPLGTQLLPETQAKVDEVRSERAKILAGLDTDNNGQVIMTQEAQTKLADLKNQELKIQEYDSQNKQRVSGEVGEGQKPIEAQPVGAGGKEAIAPSGVFQTPTQEVIIPDTPAGHVTAVMNNPTADNVQNLADNAVSLAQEVIKQGNDQGTIPQEKMPTLEETTPVVEAPQAGSVDVGGEVKPTPQKIKVLGKDVNMYNDYIPSKIEDVELDAMYSFNANSKDGIPSLLHNIAYANKREVNGVKSENWHASISGEELLKLYPKKQFLKATPQAGSVVGGEVVEPKKQNFTQFAKENGYPDDYDTSFQAQLLGGRGLEGKRQSNRSIKEQDDAFQEMQNKKAEGKKAYEKAILDGKVIDPDGKLTREGILKRDYDFNKKELESKIANAESGIKNIDGLGKMSHLDNGKLKKGYQRAVDDYNETITKHKEAIDKLKTEYEQSLKETPQAGSVGVGGEVESNWNYEGEGDAFATGKNARGKGAYIVRVLDRFGRGLSYNRAMQRGELDTKSPLTYEGDKESISAIDKNGNTVGVIKLQTDGGVEHIVVAPEFSRKGVASELIKQIEQKGAKVNFEKSKQISPDAAKLFNKIRSKQSLKEPQAGSVVGGEKKTNNVNGYEFTKTPTLESVIVEPIDKSNNAVIEKQMFVDENKNVLAKGVKYVGGGWYEIGRDNFGSVDLYNTVTKEGVSLNHKQGGRMGVVVQDFIKNNSRYNDNIAVEELLGKPSEVTKEPAPQAGRVVGGDVEAYSDTKRYNSEIKVGQKYYDNRYGDFYTIEKMTPVEGGDVDATLKYDKGKTRTESGNFLLYHIDAKQHSLSKEQPIVAETPKQEKTNEYYIYDFDNKEFVKTENAKPVKLDIEGDFFAVKGDNGYYTIYEGTSGQGIGKSGKLLRDAIKNANESIERNTKAGFPLEMAISGGIKRNGQSPRVEQSLKEPQAGSVGVGVDKKRINKIEGVKDNFNNNTRALIGALNENGENVVGWTETEGSKISGITDSGKGKVEKLGKGVQVEFYNPSTKTTSKYFVEGDANKIIPFIENFVKERQSLKETPQQSTEELTIEAPKPSAEVVEGDNKAEAKGKVKEKAAKETPQAGSVVGGEEKTNNVNGYEFTKTPTLESVIVEPIDKSNNAVIEKQMFVDENKNVLAKGVKYVGGGWYEIGRDNFGSVDLYNTVTKEGVSLNHKQGGRMGVVVQDFIKNNSRYNDNIAVRGSKFTQEEHNPKFGGSGHYKGTYFYVGLSAESKALEHGKNLTKVDIEKANLYELGEDGQTSQSLKNEAKKAGYDTRDASGYAESEYLKKQGYDGIKRGNEIVLFEPKKFEVKEKIADLPNVSGGTVKQSVPEKGATAVFVSKYSDNPLQMARREKYLDSAVMSNGKQTTERKLIEERVKQGWRVTKRTITDDAASKKLNQEYERLKRTAPIGNENHPETKRLRELEKMPKSLYNEREIAVKKEELRLESPEGTTIAITPFGEDYVNELLFKEQALKKTPQAGSVVGGDVEATAKTITEKLSKQQDNLIQSVYDKYEGEEASKKIEELFASKEYKDIEEQINQLNPGGADLSGFEKTLSERDAEDYSKYREIGYRLVAADKKNGYKPFKVTESEKKQYAELRKRFDSMFADYSKNVDAENAKTKQKAVEKSLKVTPQAGSVGVGGVVEKPINWSKERLDKEIEKLDPYESQGYEVTRNQSLKESMVDFPDKARLAFELRDFFKRMYKKDFEKDFDKRPLSSLSQFFYTDAKSLKDWVDNQIEGINNSIKSNQEYIDGLSNSKSDTKSKEMWADTIEKSKNEIERLKAEYENYEKEKGIINKKGDNVEISSKNSINEQNKEATDFGKVISASSRFRPAETVVFDKPIIGKNGNKLISYQWAYEWTMQPSGKDTELKSKRISDWTQAESSAETGRDIVHKFTVERKDGTFVTVSSETIPSLLGYVNAKEMKNLPSVVSSVKTLAKQRMQLAILKAQEAEYNAIKKEVSNLPKPKIVPAEMADLPKITQSLASRDSGFLDRVKYWKTDGETKVVYRQENNSNTPDNTTKEQLLGLWESAEIEKRGGKKPQGLYDLERRIERQEKKVEQATGSKLKAVEQSLKEPQAGSVVGGDVVVPKTLSELKLSDKTTQTLEKKLKELELERTNKLIENKGRGKFDDRLKDEIDEVKRKIYQRENELASRRNSDLESKIKDGSLLKLIADNKITAEDARGLIIESGMEVPSEIQSIVDKNKQDKKENKQSIIERDTDFLGNEKEAYMVNNDKANGIRTQEDIEYFKSNVKRAIDNGKYQKAIADGKMTANDAKIIIESYGLKVPKDISEQSLKEPQAGSVVGGEVEKKRDYQLTEQEYINKYVDDNYDVELAKEDYKNIIEKAQSDVIYDGKDYWWQDSDEGIWWKLDKKGEITEEQSDGKPKGKTISSFQYDKAVEQSLKKTPQAGSVGVGGDSMIAKRIRDNIKDLPEKDLGDAEANKNWNDIIESRKKIKSMSDEELLKEVQKGMDGKKINQAIYESYFGMDITAKDIEAELQSLKEPQAGSVAGGEVVDISKPKVGKYDGVTDFEVRTPEQLNVDDVLKRDKPIKLYPEQIIPIDNQYSEKESNWVADRDIVINEGYGSIEIKKGDKLFIRVDNPANGDATSSTSYKVYIKGRSYPLSHFIPETAEHSSLDEPNYFDAITQMKNLDKVISGEIETPQQSKEQKIKIAETLIPNKEFYVAKPYNSRSGFESPQKIIFKDGKWLRLRNDEWDNTKDYEYNVWGEYADKNELAWDIVSNARVILKDKKSTNLQEQWNKQFDYLTSENKKRVAGKAVEQALKEPQAETLEDKKAKAGESLRNLLGKTGVIKNIVPSEDSDTWNDIKNIADYIAAETGKKGKELIEAIKKYLKTNGGEAIIPQIETYEKRIIAESSQEGVETTEPTNIRIFEELDAMNEKRIEKKIDFRDSISFNKKYGDKAQLAKDITNNFEKYIDKLLKEGIIVKVKC